MSRCKAAATLRRVAWAVLLCAAVAHAGVNTFTDIGPRSGWKMLAADPAVAARVFAASDQGFYRTVDGGAHWSAIAGFVPERVAFDPGNRDRIYAVSGGSIQRSEDGGATFAPFAAFPVHSILALGFFARADIGRVAISPHAATDIYVSDGTLAWSGDAGATFAHAPQSATSYVYDFVLDPRSPGTVLVAGHAPAVVKSVDNGITWVMSAAGIPLDWAGVRIAVDPVLPSRVYLMAGRKTAASLVAASFDQYTVFVSNDGGANWQPSRLDSQGTVPWPEVQLIAVPGYVYARVGDRILASTDGGATWAAWGPPIAAQAIAAAADTLYAASLHDGVVRSDGGTWQPASGGLPSPRVARIDILDREPFSVFAATDWNASRLTELYRRSTLDNVTRPSLLAPAVDVRTWSSNEIYLDFQREPYGLAAFVAMPGTDTVLALTAQGDVVRSTDRGITFVNIGALPITIDKFAVANDGLALYACGSGSPSSPGTSWISGGLARSTDGGRTWQTLNATPEHSNFGCSALAVDPTNRDVAYIALSPDIGAGILRTSDGGATWRKVYTPLTRVEAMSVDQTDPRRLFVANYFPATVTTVDVESGFASQLGDALPGFIRDLATSVYPTPTTLFAATDKGIYMRSTAVSNPAWTLLPGSDASPVNAIRVQHAPQVPRRLTVFAATDSGTRELTIDGPGTLAPVYRFFNRDTFAHFYTASKAERDHVLATWPQFVDEGIAFYALAAPDGSSSPVYRLYNRNTGVHVYPFGDQQRAAALFDHAEMLDEGTAFHVTTAGEPGTIAVYRFSNFLTGGNLLTVDDDERAFVVRNLPQFVYGGAAPGVFQAK